MPRSKLESNPWQAPGIALAALALSMVGLAVTVAGRSDGATLWTPGVIAVAATCGLGLIFGLYLAFAAPLDLPQPPTVTEYRERRKNRARAYGALTRSLEQVRQRIAAYQQHAADELDARGFLGHLLGLETWVKQQRRLFKNPDLRDLAERWEDLCRRAEIYNERAQAVWRQVLLDARPDEVIDEIPPFTEGDRESLWALADGLRTADGAVRRAISKRL